MRGFSETHKLKLAVIHKAEAAGYRAPSGATFEEALRGAEAHLKRGGA